MTRGILRHGPDRRMFLVDLHARLEALSSLFLVATRSRLQEMLRQAVPLHDLNLDLWILVAFFADEHALEEAIGQRREVSYAKTTIFDRDPKFLQKGMASIAHERANCNALHSLCLLALRLVELHSLLLAIEDVLRLLDCCVEAWLISQLRCPSSGRHVRVAAAPKDMATPKAQ